MNNCKGSIGFSRGICMPQLDHKFILEAGAVLGVLIYSRTKQLERLNFLRPYIINHLLKMDSQVKSSQVGGRNEAAVSVIPIIILRQWRTFNNPILPYSEWCSREQQKQQQQQQQINCYQYQVDKFNRYIDYLWCEDGHLHVQSASASTFIIDNNKPLSESTNSA